MKERKNFTHVIRETGNEISEGIESEDHVGFWAIKAKSHPAPDEDCVEIRRIFPSKVWWMGRYPGTPDLI
jgi:hypothetical protein